MGFRPPDRRRSREEIDPCAVQPIDPADHPKRGGDDPIPQQRVEAAPLERDAIEPGLECLGYQPFEMAPSSGQLPPHGLLEMMVVMQQARRTQDLKGANRRVTDGMHQGQTRESQTNLDADEAYLGHRCFGYVRRTLREAQ